VHDDAQLACVERDEEDVCDGAVQLAFYVRDIVMSSGSKSVYDYYYSSYYFHFRDRHNSTNIIIASITISSVVVGHCHKYYYCSPIAILH
jgi:hypothetical protein